ncbi:MAG: hypothetical protein EZS28_020359, partial [Streblomastix strix]
MRRCMNVIGSGQDQTFISTEQNTNNVLIEEGEGQGSYAGLMMQEMRIDGFSESILHNKYTNLAYLFKVEGIVFMRDAIIEHVNLQTEPIVFVDRIIQSYLNSEIEQISYNYTGFNIGRVVTLVRIFGDSAISLLSIEKISWPSYSL